MFFPVSRKKNVNDPALPIPINGQAPSPFNKELVDEDAQTPQELQGSRRISDSPGQAVNGVNGSFPAAKPKTDEQTVDVQGSRTLSESPSQIVNGFYPKTNSAQSQSVSQEQKPPVGFYPVANKQTELQRLEGEWNTLNQKDYSKAQYDDQGNLVKAAGKDRDRNWTTGDKVISGLIGAAKGFFSGGGLIGAGIGAAEAATNRNYMEQRNDASARARLIPKISAAQQQQKFNSEQSKAIAEREKLLVDTENARLAGKGKEIDNLNALSQYQKNLLVNDPRWIAAEKAEMLTADDVKYFNQLLGTNLSPANWGEFVEIDDNGVSKIRRKKSPNYQVNPTVGVNVMKKPVGVTVTTGDGDDKKEQTFPMLPKDAADLTVRTQTEEAKAKAQETKEARAEVVESAKINFKSKLDWRKQTHQARNKIPGLETTVKNLDSQIAEMDDYIKSNAGSDMSEQQRIVTGLKKDRNTYNAELEKNRAIANTPLPASFSLPARPNKSKNARRGNYSVGQIQDIINRGNR